MRKREGEGANGKTNGHRRLLTWLTVFTTHNPTRIHDQKGSIQKDYRDTNPTNFYYSSREERRRLVEK